MSDSYNSYLVDDFSSGSIDPPWVVRNWGGLQSASVVSGAIHLRTTSGDIWSNTFSSCGVVRPAPVGTGWTAAINLLARNNARYSRTLLLLEKDQPDSRFVGLVENDRSGEWTYLWRDGQNVASDWTGGNPFQLFNPAVNPWHCIRYNGSTVDFFVGGKLIGSRAIGWTPGFVALAGKSEVSPTIAATLEYDNYAVVPSGGSLTELYNGPEPLNTVAPTLSIDESSWSGTVGSWDSQSNGTVTYAWELRDADDDSVIQSGSGESPSGSGSYSGDYYLWVRASNSGGYDSAEDSTSSTETVAGGTSPINLENVDSVVSVASSVDSIALTASLATVDSVVTASSAADAVSIEVDAANVDSAVQPVSSVDAAAITAGLSGTESVSSITSESSTASITAGLQTSDSVVAAISEASDATVGNGAYDLQNVDSVSIAISSVDAASVEVGTASVGSIVESVSSAGSVAVIAEAASVDSVVQPTSAPDPIGVRFALDDVDSSVESFGDALAMIGVFNAPNVDSTVVVVSESNDLTIPGETPDAAAVINYYYQLLLA